MRCNVEYITSSRCHMYPTVCFPLTRFLVGGCESHLAEADVCADGLPFAVGIWLDAASDLKSRSQQLCTQRKIGSTSSARPGFLSGWYIRCRSRRNFLRASAVDCRASWLLKRCIVSCDHCCVESTSAR